MKIDNISNETFNFTEELQSLFDAMSEGKTIKEVICMSGKMNENKPEKDFILKNFIPVEYTVAACYRNGNEPQDLVEVETEDGDTRAFYMNWVRSFKL